MTSRVTPAGHGATGGKGMQEGLTGEGLSWRAGPSARVESGGEPPHSIRRLAHALHLAAVRRRPRWPKSSRVPGLRRSEGEAWRFCRGRDSSLRASATLGAAFRMTRPGPVSSNEVFVARPEGSHLRWVQVLHCDCRIQELRSWHLGADHALWRRGRSPGRPVRTCARTTGRPGGRPLQVGPYL